MSEVVHQNTWFDCHNYRFPLQVYRIGSQLRERKPRHCKTDRKQKGSWIPPFLFLFFVLSIFSFFFFCHLDTSSEKMTSSFIILPFSAVAIHDLLSKIFADAGLWPSPITKARITFHITFTQVVFCSNSRPNNIWSQGSSACRWRYLNYEEGVW